MSRLFDLGVQKGATNPIWGWAITQHYSKLVNITHNYSTLLTFTQHYSQLLNITHFYSTLLTFTHKYAQFLIYSSKLLIITYYVS